MSKWYCTTHKRECTESGCPPEQGGILMPCEPVEIGSEINITRHYRQSARPFIVFPVDNSTEGWIQVAADLETMINYLIEQNAQKVVVRYIDRRVDGSVEDPRDYGLSVEAFRDYYEDPLNHEFYQELLRKCWPPDGKPDKAPE